MSKHGPKERKKLAIRRDDTVIVISGRLEDKGRTGKVLSVDRVKERVVVEGVNVRKRHLRPNPANPSAEAGIVERPMPIHVSNVALADPKDGKPTRIGTRVNDAGLKVRYAKRSGAQID